MRTFLPRVPRVLKRKHVTYVTKKYQEYIPWTSGRSSHGTGSLKVFFSEATSESDQSVSAWSSKKRAGTESARGRSGTLGGDFTPCTLTKGHVCLLGSRRQTT